MTENQGDERDLRMRVRSRTVAAERIAVFELEPAEGRLPTWSPGAHVDLLLGPDLIRQYSLCGDPLNDDVFRIAVLREESGRGGSALVHDELTVGRDVLVRGPRNHFELVPAQSYVFIAGGIGITPLMPMIEQATRAGAEWELHYGGRTRAAMSFVDELSAKGSTHVYPQDSAGLIDLPSILRDPRPECLVYCCGPEPLLDAVESFGDRWPPGAIHVERFAPKQLDSLSSAEEFEVELAETGTTLTVPADKTVLEVLEDADVEVFSSCQDGTCGTCETVVLSGEVDHRDSIMTAEEQAANDRMYVCVSRAACPRLVLGL